MGNRQAATDFILTNIDKLLPGSENTRLYKDWLKGMSDSEFEQLMQQLESGEQTLWFISPNLDEHKLSVDRNLKLAKELGHEFFQRLWLTDPKTGVTYLTPVHYLVVDLPIRRQQQLLIKKIKIPDNNRHIDELTGQVTGPSRGSKISFPELQVLYAQGQDRTIEELMKFRGGDIKAFQAMNRSIIETGGASMDAIKKTPTKVRSVETLGVLLKSMHLDNTL